MMKLFNAIYWQLKVVLGVEDGDYWLGWGRYGRDANSHHHRASLGNSDGVLHVHNMGVCHEAKGKKNKEGLNKDAEHFDLEMLQRDDREKVVGY